MSSIKPKTLESMTQMQVDFFSEWDPRYLQSLKEPNTCDVQEQSNAILPKQSASAHHASKSQSSVSFEEWKATTVQDGMKENAGPLSTPVKNKGASTSAQSRPRVSPARRAAGLRPAGHQDRNQSRGPPAGPLTDASTTTTSNSKRNIKANSSSMNPVYSPKRHNKAGVPHRGVSGRRMADSSASASTGEESQATPPMPVSSDIPANPRTNPTIPAPPAAEEPKKGANPKATIHQHDCSTKGGYTAPNGTFLGSTELSRLACGVQIENNFTVYFKPSFIIDPWEKLPVMKTTCLRFY
ncbi:hypothetical protein PHISP_00832 [Aspergillus sp. HF37]|nr:hypothetical protein PHISP_00832 [Aspergillus sp. HF37]